MKKPAIKSETINVLAQEIAAWAEKNFPVHIPAWGVLEEIGELTHCLLKRAQGIRGFADDAHFKKESLDAVADIAVYMLHHIAIAGKRFFVSDEWETSALFDITDKNDVQEVLAEWVDNVACLLRDEDFDTHGVEIHISILQTASMFAVALGSNLETVLVETWDRVKQRDWAKNPYDAHKVSPMVEVASAGVSAAAQLGAVTAAAMATAAITNNTAC